MSLTETPVARPPRDMIQRPTRKKRVSPKVMVGLKAIVWEGQELDKAARIAGLTTQALRMALAQPHVIQAMKAERDVFIAYARAGNTHALVDVRDNSRNDTARVAAARVIEHHVDEQGTGAAAAMPGITIVIGNPDNTLQSQPKLINDGASGVTIEATAQTPTVSIKRLDSQE